MVECEALYEACRKMCPNFRLLAREQAKEASDSAPIVYWLMDHGGQKFAGAMVCRCPEDVVFLLVHAREGVRRAVGLPDEAEEALRQAEYLGLESL